MAVIHDMMPAFELFLPSSVDDALALLDRHGSDAWVMAGGLDSFDWLKDRIRKPQYVVDLGGIEALRGVKAVGDGLEIGAMTTLTEIVRDPLVREKFGVLMQGAEAAASPQIRNQGTLGGNLTQDARCWYLPRRLVVLPGRRQHLLRRHADRHQPRARHLRRRPVRGREPVRHGAGDDRARRQVRHPLGRRRARRRRRELLHRPGHRHHAHDRAPAR